METNNTTPRAFKPGDIVYYHSGTTTPNKGLVVSVMENGYYYVCPYGCSRGKDIHRSKLEFWTNSVEKESERPTIIDKIDLSELLEGYEGETFYSQVWGQVILVAIHRYHSGTLPIIEVQIPDCKCKNRKIPADGFLNSDVRVGNIVLWPTEEEFFKRHDKPLEVWSDWLRNRRPKIWRAAKGEQFYYVVGDGEIGSRPDMYDDECNAYYRGLNYFQTPEQARDAANCEYFTRLQKASKRNLSS